MVPLYREDKTTQAASLLLQAGNGKMYYLKLLKLLYLIDREALRLWGRPITCDKYVSMDHGPVLSTTYNRISLGPSPSGTHYWHDYISDPEDYQVKLKKDPGTEALSTAEIDLIRKIYQKYRDTDRWELAEITHTLPEWKNPEGSSIPISLDELLTILHSDEKERELIREELDAAAFLDELK